MEALLDHRKQMLANGLAGSQWGFSDTIGGLLSSHNVNYRSFKPLLKKAGVPAIRFHDLRHTFATRLVQAGVDLYTVQKLGRWKTISMVMRYAHHHPESLRAGIEVLDLDRMGPSTKLAQSEGVPGVEGCATC